MPEPFFLHRIATPGWRLAIVMWFLCLSTTMAAIAQPASAHNVATIPSAAASNPAKNEQCEASSPSVAAYAALRRRAPHLFASPGDWQRGEIGLLTESALLCEAQTQMFAKYRHQSDGTQAWLASRAGVVLQDPYILVLREAVRFPSGKLGLYNRKVTRATLDGGAAGAYCIPLLADGRAIMVKEYRHQERRWRLSVPGGFRNRGETAEQAARREAEEETGFALQTVTRLGDVDADGEAVPLFVGFVAGDAALPSPDEGEALRGVVALPVGDLKDAIVASGYRDAEGMPFVLQGNLGSAVIMLEHFLAHADAMHGSGSPIPAP